MRYWKAAAFLTLSALLQIFCCIKASNAPSDQNKQINRLDTIIYGKRLMVKDTTQYASSFIKELKKLYSTYETLTVKDDSFLITSRSNQGLFSYNCKIPKSLELNRETVFSSKNKDKILVLKRTNYTDLEYRVKNEKEETLSSGTAVLQSTFFLGAEMDHDENGNETESYQYFDTDSGCTLIKVEIFHARFASITYLDRKANKLEALYQLLRE
jgi:hypothetical protein